MDDMERMREAMEADFEHGFKQSAQPAAHEEKHAALIKSPSKPTAAIVEPKSATPGLEKVH